MTQTQKNTMYEQISQHGNNLNTIFNTGLDPVTLCKKLRNLENKAHTLSVYECNTGEDKHVELCKILTKVKAILFPDVFKSTPELYKAVFINGDPRGYSLKIKSEYVKDNNLRIEQDWGGYGLICPDFTPQS